MNKKAQRLLQLTLLLMCCSLIFSILHSPRVGLLSDTKSYDLIQLFLLIGCVISYLKSLSEVSNHE
jgi:hypothetical protein